VDDSLDACPGTVIPEGMPTKALLPLHYALTDADTTFNTFRGAESNLLALQQALRTHTYRPGRATCFVTDGPKPREVFAADFRDREAHHLLVSHEEHVFEPLFIHDSYACRMGIGTWA
jgi:hypothetical protein